MQTLLNSTFDWRFSNPEPELHVVRDEIFDQIESYENLQEGWDFGEGIPVSQSTIANAKDVYAICRKCNFFIEPHANTEGNITLIAYIDDYFLEIDIDESRYLLLRYARGRGNDYTIIWKNRKKSFSELESILSEISFEWKKSTSLGQFISRNILFNSEDLEATRYLSPWVEVSPFSMSDVQEQNQTTIFAYT